MSYGTKVIRKHDELVIASGGKQTVEEGATVSGIESGGGEVAWADITGKPAVIAAGADAAAARAAIGAGTSSLALGTTSSTAAAGNHNHAVTADVTSGLAAAASIQALAVALSARIKALEDAAA